MIARLTVNSFKSLHDVSVDLGVVNVFIGANGSGKSNLLEALGVLGAAASGRVDDESLLRRGVRPGVPALYKTSFRGSRASPFIVFGAHWVGGEGEATYQVGLDNPIKDPRPAWRYRTEELRWPHEKIVGRSPRSRDAGNPEAGLAALKMVDMAPASPPAMLVGALRDFAIYTPTTAALRGLVPDAQQREPVGLSGGRLPEAVTELLLARHKGRKERLYYQGVLDGVLDLIDWADNFGAAPSAMVPLSPSVSSSPRVLRFWDSYMAEKRNILTGYDASEGALYVLFAAVLAALPDVPRVFAVDNFDHGLNPRLARKLIRSFCTWAITAPSPRQVLLTTHSPLILDGIDLSDDRMRLFTVDRDSRGRTVVRRVELDPGLLAKARDGWTLSRLWVMGEIGGVPSV
jgi:energy-coupling factor transporter ATP-binding protein EcfA2